MMPRYECRYGYGDWGYDWTIGNLKIQDTYMDMTTVYIIWNLEFCINVFIQSITFLL